MVYMVKFHHRAGNKQVFIEPGLWATGSTICGTR